MAALNAVLVDVGGTLWSERSTASAEVLRAARDQRLQAAGVGEKQLVPLGVSLAERLRDAHGLDYLDIWSVIEQACVETGVSDISAEAIRHANCLPAKSTTSLLPDARTLS